jgi:hypothetical protein
MLLFLEYIELYNMPIMVKHQLEKKKWIDSIYYWYNYINFCYYMGYNLVIRDRNIRISNGLSNIIFYCLWIVSSYNRYLYLISNPRNKGLLLLIIGSLITGVGSYYTINIFLNLEIFKSEPQIIVYVVIPIIIGIIIVIFGIKLIWMEINHNLV